MTHLPLCNGLQLLATGDDWRQVCAGLLEELREAVVFDHAVLYAPPALGMEVLFARAMGRGRSAEAEADWGVAVAEEVFQSTDIRIFNQSDSVVLRADERIKAPLFLGLPLRVADRVLGALVLVRFGNPLFTQEDARQVARCAAGLALARERHLMLEKIRHLERLERQMRLQEDFVSTVSHELRTPLGFIKGYTTSLLREDVDWDPQTRREFLQIIDEEADRLAELLEKVLESARLQSDTLDMSFQPVRLDALIRDVAAREMVRDRTMRVKLDLQATTPVLGDSLRLSQVFENLFSNARKYAPGALVTVQLRQTENWVAIRFADTGPGIQPDHLPFIFERFYRVPGQTGVKGTGLGLFICREIIRAHGGEINAVSPPEGGTVFEIRLPLQPVPGDLSSGGKEQEDG